MPHTIDDCEDYSFIQDDSPFDIAGWTTNAVPLPDPAHDPYDQELEAFPFPAAFTFEHWQQLPQFHTGEASGYGEYNEEAQPDIYYSCNSPSWYALNLPDNYMQYDGNWPRFGGGVEQMQYDITGNDSWGPNTFLFPPWSAFPAPVDASCPMDALMCQSEHDEKPEDQEVTNTTIVLSISLE